MSEKAKFVKNKAYEATLYAIMLVLLEWIPQEYVNMVFYTRLTLLT